MSTQFESENNQNVELLAAELTSAAYPVLLRGGVAHSWIDLELGLWKAMTKSLRVWARDLQISQGLDNLKSGRHDLVAGLIDDAVLVAREQGIYEPLIEMRLGLREAFRSTIRHVQPASQLRHLES
jgi:hypothetical protein